MGQVIRLEELNMFIATLMTTFAFCISHLFWRDKWPTYLLPLMFCKNLNTTLSFTNLKHYQIVVWANCSNVVILCNNSSKVNTFHSMMPLIISLRCQKSRKIYHKVSISKAEKKYLVSLATFSTELFT